MGILILHFLKSEVGFEFYISCKLFLHLISILKILTVSIQIPIVFGVKGGTFETNSKECALERRFEWEVSIFVFILIQNQILINRFFFNF